MKRTEKTILIIDDDLDFQFIVSSMLKLSGFVVKSLMEGELTVTIDAAKTCDVVLLDVELPGVNGVDIGKKLKSLPETANIPIILWSGHHDCERLFVESQANILFKKPFLFSQLLSKIKELVASNVARAPDGDPPNQLSCIAITTAI